MKRMKKIVSLLVTMVMVLAMTINVFAAHGTNNNSGKIKITNAVSGETYSVYQLLVLESYNEEAKAYSYKANSAWESWLKNQTNYVSFDDQEYVTWVEGANAAEFAKIALAHVQTLKNDGNLTNDIEPATTPITATGTTVEFSGLNLGYYLVDTTLGTLCSLDTTNPTVDMTEKNEAPTIDKQVKENSNQTWGDKNDATIGDTVEFQTFIYAKKGAQNYVLHDTMSKGLTWNTGSVKVYVVNAERTTELATSNYTVKSGSDVSDNCTFEIHFKQEYLDTITANTTLKVTYSAVLNAEAEVANAETNETVLKYGDTPSSTAKDITRTYTWDMGVLKYGNNKKENVLKDAKFVLLNNAKDKVANITNGKVSGWTVISEITNEKQEIAWPENAVLKTGEDGKINIAGLDSATYYLREIQAPDGYNKLAEDEEVVITSQEKENSTVELTYTKVTAEINNNSGTELPSTGGMGTTVLYIAGAVLVLAAVVLLFVRRRAGKEA